MPSAAALAAALKIGTSRAKISKFTRSFNISLKCPKNPKPVTSVAADMLTPSIARTAAKFNRRIVSTAASIPRASSISAFNAVLKTPVPSGLVSISASPSFAALLLQNLRGSTRPVTLSP